MKLFRPILSGLKGIFLFLTIMLFMSCFTATLYYLITDPSAIENINSVLTLAAELFGGSLITVAFAKQLKKHLNNTDSVSKGIKNFLSNEPIVVGILWIFIVAQLITFTYLLPIHALVIEVKNPPTLTETSNLEVIVLPAEVKLARIESTDGSAYFKSKNAFTWGDSLHIRIEADGYEDDTTNIKWSGFSFLDLFSGYRASPVNLKRRTRRFQIEVVPQSARIQIKNESLDTLFKGNGQLTVDKNIHLTVQIDAENYISEEHAFTVSSDTLLNFSLDPKLAKLILKAYSEGGIEQEDLVIYLNSSKTNHQTGQAIMLTPGTYDICLKEKRQNSYVAVPEFTITLNPGQVKIIEDLTTQVLSNNVLCR